VQDITEQTCCDAHAGPRRPVVPTSPRTCGSLPKGTAPGARPVAASQEFATAVDGHEGSHHFLLMTCDGGEHRRLATVTPGRGALHVPGIVRTSPRGRAVPAWPSRTSVTPIMKGRVATPADGASLVPVKTRLK